MAPLLAADSDAPTQNLVVDVLAPVAVDTAYSYRVPAHLNLEPGDFVAMPLGTRMATGVVWATRAGGGDNLKSVAEQRDWPPLRRRCAISSTGSPAGPWRRAARCCAWRCARPRRPQRRRRNSAAQDRQAAGAPDARARARPRGAGRRCAAGQIRARRSRRLQRRRDRRPRRRRRAGGGRTAARARRADARPGFRRRGRWSPIRRRGARRSSRAVESAAFGPSCSKGVTGSGKTEVYFEAVAAALRRGGRR